MNQDDKKIIAEGIAEGIENGFWKPILYLIIAIFIGSVITVASVEFKNYNQDQCLKDGSCSASVMVQELKGTIQCSIYVGNSTYTEQTPYRFSIIGYSEANAKFEQMKPQLNDWYKNHNSTWSVKYLDCK